jgi:hypothetical protein
MVFVSALAIGLYGSPPSRNLVVNGEFRHGHRGFRTEYGAANTLLGDGVYWIGTDPVKRHPKAVSIHDHTSGKGAMLLLNGSATHFLPFWRETLKVHRSTHYEFTGWATPWSSNPDGPATDPSPARLVLTINGRQIGDPFPLDRQSGLWQRFRFLWDSADAVRADIRMTDENIEVVGNDFGVDDLSFVEVPVP